MTGVQGWVAIGIVGMAVIWMVWAYNSLVALRLRTQNAWAEVDVQLKRRHDLIPNLVETARGYMQYERGTLEAVTQARAQAVAAASAPVGQRLAAESALSGALGKLFAVAENYPQLHASENMQMQQEELTSTENRIAAARQFYNDEMMKYNTAQATFPRSLLSHPFGFSPGTMFSADEEDRATVQVKF
jgi:LemA protein